MKFIFRLRKSQDIDGKMIKEVAFIKTDYSKCWDIINKKYSEYRVIYLEIYFGY
jgi:hypothetical protein